MHGSVCTQRRYPSADVPEFAVSSNSKTAAVRSKVFTFLHGILTNESMAVRCSVVVVVVVTLVAAATHVRRGAPAPFPSIPSSSRCSCTLRGRLGRASGSTYAPSLNQRVCWVSVATTRTLAPSSPLLLQCAKSTGSTCWLYACAVQLCSIGCVSDCVQLMRRLLVLSRDGAAVRVSTWVSTHVCQNLVGLLRQRLEDAQAILATLQDASNGRLHVLVRSLPVWSCLVPPSLSAWLSVCVAVCGCVYVSAQRKQQEKLDEMVDATLRTAAGVVGSTTEMLRSNQAKLHGVLDSMTVRGGIMNHAWR